METALQFLLKLKEISSVDNKGRSVRLRPLFYPRGETVREEIKFNKKYNVSPNTIKAIVMGVNLIL